MKRSFVIFLGFALIAPAAVYAHGGGLDSYGCHHNRKQGGYHCHRGEFAGQSFDSKAQMIEKAKSKEKVESQSKSKN